MTRKSIFAAENLLYWLLIFAPVALVLEHVVHAARTGSVSAGTQACARPSSSAPEADSSWPLN